MCFCTKVSCTGFSLFTNRFYGLINFHAWFSQTRYHSIAPKLNWYKSIRVKYASLSTFDMRLEELNSLSFVLFRRISNKWRCTTCGQWNSSTLVTRVETSSHAQSVPINYPVVIRLQKPRLIAVNKTFPILPSSLITERDERFCAFRPSRNLLLSLYTHRFTGGQTLFSASG